MRLYSMTGVSSVANDDHGEFEADEEGGFEFPDELGRELHNTHIGGQKAWEDSGERSLRLLAEEEARRRDPATLLAAVEELTRQQSEATAEALKNTKPTKTPAKKA